MSAPASFWTLFEGVCSIQDSSRFYWYFKSRVDPEAATLTVFGKKCKEPRLTKTFARKAGSMHYSGTTKELDGEWPSELEELNKIAVAKLGLSASFDTALVNYYRDGNDTIGWHSDKDAIDNPIASFSFGVSRDFFIRPKDGPKPRPTTKLVLDGGSMLAMLPGMQERFEHSLPVRKGVHVGRVNVTLRMHNRVSSGLSVRS